MLVESADNREMHMSESDNANPTGSVECQPARDPAVRWFLMAALLVGMGIWCWTDRREKPAEWNDINTVSAYLFNNYGPFVMVPAGLLLTGFGVRFLKRKLVADEKGLGYAGGDTIAWSDIKELDATRLGKGFLTIRHEPDKRLILDSWKLQNFKQMVAFIDQHVPVERQKR